MQALVSPVWKDREPPQPSAKRPSQGRFIKPDRILAKPNCSFRTVVSEKDLLMPHSTTRSLQIGHDGNCRELAGKLGVFKATVRRVWSENEKASCGPQKRE